MAWNSPAGQCEGEVCKSAHCCWAASTWHTRSANSYLEISQPNILTRSTGCLTSTPRAHPCLCNTSTDATENHTPNSTPACRSLSMKAAALPPVFGVYIAVSHQRSIWHKGHQHLTCNSAAWCQLCYTCPRRAVSTNLQGLHSAPVLQGHESCLARKPLTTTQTNWHAIRAHSAAGNCRVLRLKSSTVRGFTSLVHNCCSKSTCHVCTCDQGTTASTGLSPRGSTPTPSGPDMLPGILWAPLILASICATYSSSNKELTPERGTAATSSAQSAHGPSENCMRCKNGNACSV
jgi:hypothetical protein